jgi:cytochrome c biogenesis factor
MNKVTKNKIRIIELPIAILALCVGISSIFFTSSIITPVICASLVVIICMTMIIRRRIEANIIVKQLLIVYIIIFGISFGVFISYAIYTFIR